MRIRPTQNTATLPAATTTQLFGVKPKVTKADLFLAFAALAVNATSLGWPSLNQLAAVATCQCVIIALLVIKSGNEVLCGAPPGKLLLTASLFLYFALESALSAANGFTSRHTASPSTMTEENIQTALIYIGCSALLVLVGYGIKIKLPTYVDNLLRREDAQGNWRWRTRYALGTLTFTPIVLQTTGLSADGVLDSLQGSRTITLSTEEAGLLVHLAHIGLAAASLILVEGSMQKSARRIVTLAAGVVLLLPHLSRGTRHFTVIALMPTVFALLTDKKRRGQLAVAALMLFGIIQMQYALRDRGWNTVDRDSIVESQTQTAVTGQFEALVQSIAFVPSERDYFRELMSVQFLTHNIPRSWWPNKPISESWLEFNAAYLPVQSSNLTPSILGQYHMNWGFVGVMVISLVFGAGARALDTCAQEIEVRRQLTAVVVLGMLYGALVASFRYLHPLYFVYPQAAALVFLMLSRKRVTNRLRHAPNRLRWPEKSRLVCK